MLHSLRGKRTPREGAGQRPTLLLDQGQPPGTHTGAGSMLHQEFELGRQRAVDLRTEVERNRLEARLHKAHHKAAKGSLSEQISPPKGLFARSAAFATALFR